MPDTSHDGRRPVIFALLGTDLDRREQSARPSLEVARELLLPAGGRLVIWHQRQPRHREMASELAADIRDLGHGVTAEPDEFKKRFNPWKFDEVYDQLAELAKAFPFDDSREEYFVSLATGTDVAKVALFLLAERLRVRVKLVQFVPPSNGQSGRVSIVDLNEARYAQITGRADSGREPKKHPLGGTVIWGKTFIDTLEQVLMVGRRTTSPVLLTGPSGVGKSFIARELSKVKSGEANATPKGATSPTRKSARNPANEEATPLIEANCATLRGDVLLSTLFGHERGAFTGAEKAHKGLIEQADGKTLFLDEIGELPEAAQAMLLTALDTGEYRPLGGTEVKKSQFQLIAATNRDLLADVNSGRFREDLFFRLSTFSFPIPGLKDRPEDIEPLLRFTIGDIRKELKDGHLIYFDPEAERCFLAYAKKSDWPGNLREFRQMVLRAAVRSDSSGRVRKRAVELVWSMATQARPAFDEDRVLREWIDPERLAEIDLFDRVQLARVIEVCLNARNQAEAGRRLFDQSRNQKTSNNDSHRLAQYLKKFGLTWDMVGHPKAATPRIS